MPKTLSFGKIDVRLVSAMEETRGMPEAETPFRIAVFGDFGARGNRGLFDPDLANRKPFFVDRDNFDVVLKKIGVAIKLPIPGSNSLSVNIKFSELDDFRPERLFETLEVFQALRDTRQNLNDPSTFAALAKELQYKDKALESSEPLADKEMSLKNNPEQLSGNLLDQILEETQAKKTETELPSESSELDSFLRQIVAPHLIPKPDPKQTEMVSAVDAATGELMRVILHHPDFQSIEAAWRAVYFLVSRLETDSQLKLYLFDISKSELAADLTATEDLRPTGMYKLLVEQTVKTFGGEPWAVLAGNYTFEQTPEDIELLGRLAKIAKASGAPFIAAASEKILGCESLSETPRPDDWKKTTNGENGHAWELLRNQPESPSLGLMLPRFLLRLPYGEETDIVEGFVFEEMPDAPNHNHYLWGNPSFACVYLLGQTFAQYGWNFQSGIMQEVEGMPLHIYKEHGVFCTKPCAEVVFTEQAVEIIQDKGIMPLISFKNRDVIHLRIQSLASPPTQLAGPWII